MAVGGHFYTVLLLGQSLKGVKLQEDYPAISNEGLDESVYCTLGRILRGCDSIATPGDKARISASCALQRDPLPIPSDTKKLSISNLQDILWSHGILFDLEATQAQLARLLRSSSGERPARTEFCKAAKSLSERFLQSLGSNMGEAAE